MQLGRLEISSQHIDPDGELERVYSREIFISVSTHDTWSQQSGQQQCAEDPTSRSLFLLSSR